MMTPRYASKTQICKDLMRDPHPQYIAASYPMPHKTATIAPNPIINPALPIHALAVSAAPAVLIVVLGEPVALGDVPLCAAAVDPEEAVPFDAAPLVVCVTIEVLVE